MSVQKRDTEMVTLTPVHLSVIRGRQKRARGTFQRGD